ncbi:thioesterase family protein [Pseudonocardia phyllosphaerae]|uniref:thioesterase family protein n=1 Tax=Pseudonocardia phyllosphaerae TaxID=3390502 RepID=UPI003979814E
METTTEPGPFYLPDTASSAPGGTEHFTATHWTTGPWFAEAQHMGPPSALLARALERVPGGEGKRIARITVEVLGAVPSGAITVSAGVERPGRTIELLHATMSAGGRDVLRARAWRLAASDTAAVASGAADPLPGREHATIRDEHPDGWLPGFLDAMEWGWLDGALDEPGPGRAWIRMRVPLVEGEPTTPLERVMVAADCANGLAAPLDVRGWLFLNTELTVHLLRAPAGDGAVGVSAQTVVGPEGLGTCTATLFDDDGQVGRITQALTVRAR